MHPEYSTPKSDIHDVTTITKIKNGLHAYVLYLPHPFKEQKLIVVGICRLT